MPFIPLNKKSFVSVFMRNGIYYKGGAVPQQIYCFITMWQSDGYQDGNPVWRQRPEKNKEMAGKYLAHGGEKLTERMMAKSHGKRGGLRGKWRENECCISVLFGFCLSFSAYGFSSNGGGLWVERVDGMGWTLRAFHIVDIVISIILIAVVKL